MQRPDYRLTIASAALAVLAMLFATIAAGDDNKPLRGVALVIGQSDYASLPKLDNPKNDARAIDSLLDGLGFDVTRVLDGTDDKLKQKLSRFVEDAADADVAVVYYSGHGIEAAGEDYMVPVDADLSTPQRAGVTLVPVSELLDQLARTVPLTIVLLDACRTGAFPPGTMIQPLGSDTPVPAQTTGLGVIRGPSPIAKASAPSKALGVVIGFAASPGEPALDGAPGTENSPYATALLKHFGAGGYSFGDVMTMVSEEVYLETDARQLPWVNSSLRRMLTFGAPAEPADPDQAAIKTARRQLLLNIAGTPAQTQKYVESLAGDDKVPLDALYGMLDVLGVKAGPDAGDLQQQMKAGAEKLKELVAERPPPVGSDPELSRLSKLANEAESEGAVALALKYREDASARADTLLDGKQTEIDQLGLDMVDIANTYAANAATASLNFDHMRAAELYGKAFQAIKDWNKPLSISYKIDQADALTDQGYYVADNDALRQALSVYEEAIPLAPRDSDPSTWGRLRDRMGQAQGMLGARLGDQAMMAGAQQSFEDALTVLTRDSVPDRWAAVENNLGDLLYQQGELTGDAAVLRQSISALDSALEVYTRDANPVRWATVISNRGSAQIALAHTIYAATDEVQTAALEAGQKDVDNIPEVAAALKESIGILSDTIGSLQDAVAARPRSDNPLDWAMIENSLAGALSERAKLTDSADDYKAAASALRGVLEVHDPVRTPAQWSISAGNLAATLRNYAAIGKDPAPLLEATDLLTRAIDLTPQTVAPGQWADLETKLGNVWADRAGYDHDPVSVDQAVAAYQASATVLTPAADIDAWGRAQLYSVSTLLKTAVSSGDLVRIERAHDIAVKARDTLTAGQRPDAVVFANMIPALDQLIAASGGK